MGSRKQISVNLRDLQRVVAVDNLDIPSHSGEADAEAIDADNIKRFGAAKKFEYKLSSNRWGYEEDDDDDFDDVRIRREPTTESNFGSVGRVAGQKEKFRGPSTTFGRSSESTCNVGDTNSPKDEVWRSSTGYRSKTPDISEEDSWRNVNPVANSSSHAFNDSQHTTGKGYNSRTESGGGNDGFGGHREKDEVFARRESTSNHDDGAGYNSSGKKLYVPPSMLKCESENKPTSDRFSCLEDPSDRRISTSIGDSTTNDRECFASLRRENTRESMKDFQRDRNRDRPTAGVSRLNHKESSKGGAFVPSYRRNQQAERPKTVEDIFKEAAGISDFVESEKCRKGVSNSAEQQLLQKREAVLKYNRIFECSPETVKSVEMFVESLIAGKKPVDDFENSFANEKDTESLVPSVVTCLIVAKSCEGCSSLEEVCEKFGPFAGWLRYLMGKNSDPSFRRRLLVEVAKFIGSWGFPTLSDSVYLLEAVFDSLLYHEVVRPDDFTEWLKNEVDEVPDRLTAIIQLMAWKKWLTGEVLVDVEEENVGFEEEEEDIDIEALVPKPIRLTKGVKY